MNRVLTMSDRGVLFLLFFAYNEIVSLVNSWISVISSNPSITMNLAKLGFAPIATRTFAAFRAAGVGVFYQVQRNTSPYGCDILAYLWLDQDRTYFIASGSSMDSAANMEGIRSHQLEEISTNEDPVDVNPTIMQTKASEIYYGACYNIDQHNRCRQESLDIWKKLQTHEWYKRANIGIFSMSVLYAWICNINAKKVEETQEVYYLKLSEEIIDNLLDANIFTRRRKRGDKTRDVTTIPNPLIGDNGTPK